MPSQLVLVRPQPRNFCLEPGFRSWTEETASEVEPWSSEGVQL
jgi:hypothetical protein